MHVWLWGQRHTVNVCMAYSVLISVKGDSSFKAMSVVQVVNYSSSARAGEIKVK